NDERAARPDARCDPGRSARAETVLRAGARRAHGLARAPFRRPGAFAGRGPAVAVDRVAIALGSNLGDRIAHLNHAIARLQTVLRDRWASGFFEPVPLPAH